MIKQTYWNGEECEARIVSIVVSEGPHPLPWYKQYIGKRRDAVEVTYYDEVFYLDWPGAWSKITIGKGSPRYGHGSLYPVEGSVNERYCLDPFCPCQDGDSCHYVTVGDSQAWPIPVEYALPNRSYERILPEDMPEV